MLSKNRERLLNEATAHEFFKRVLEQAQPHLSKEHFTVDGTVIEAWASQKSFQPNDGGDEDGANFHGQQRRNFLFRWFVGLEIDEPVCDSGGKDLRSGNWSVSPKRVTDANRHFLAWSAERQIRLSCIRPGRPVQKGRVQSFGERSGDECVNAEWVPAMSVSTYQW